MGQNPSKQEKKGNVKSTSIHKKVRSGAHMTDDMRNDDRAAEAIPSSWSVASSASISSSSSSSFIPLTPSPRFRLPLPSLSGDELPTIHVVSTDIGLIELKLICRTPLVMRAERFVTTEERAELLAATQSNLTNDDADIDNGRTRNSKGGNAGWERYQPYIPSLGTTAISPVATMYKCFLKRAKKVHPLLDRLAARIAQICQVDVSRISALDGILRYQRDQQFQLHKDDKETKSMPRGWRQITALMYLEFKSDGEDEQASGGHTCFPSLEDSRGNRFEYHSTPTPGSLLLFRNVLPGTDVLDQRAQHRAEPCTGAEKYCIQCYVTENAGYDKHWD